ncbi:MAG: siderophore-iron reductase FhuF [Gemmatimonadota bacterium]|nr:siderophore-iron reductase FhuF [Gemmatimonadota bacterium]
MSSDHEGARDSSWFDPLIMRHVAPVVEILSARYRVGRGLLWGNAAHYMEWALAELEARPDAVAEDARRARGELLDRREWPGLGRNPLHGAIRYVSDGEAEIRRRRVCCLRHLLPGVAGCGSLCPLAHVREEH